MTGATISLLSEDTLLSIFSEINEKLEHSTPPEVRVELLKGAKELKDREQVEMQSINGLKAKFRSRGKELRSSSTSKKTCSSFQQSRNYQQWIG